jgi:delta(3,5)-delta(2,4)-dienoyl-CoA isomerase
MTSYNFIYFNITFPAPLVAHVEISRVRKRNAFIEPMWRELHSIFNQLSHDAEVRAIVLSGAGDHAFSTGLDFGDTSVQAMLQIEDRQDPARKAARLRRWISGIQDCIGAVEKCEKRKCLYSAFALPGQRAR